MLYIWPIKAERPLFSIGNCIKKVVGLHFEVGSNPAKVYIKTLHTFPSGKCIILHWIGLQMQIKFQTSQNTHLKRIPKETLNRQKANFFQDPTRSKQTNKHPLS